VVGLLAGGAPEQLAEIAVRQHVAAQTALVVLGIIAAKLVISAFSLEFISLSPLFTQPGGPGRVRAGA